MSVRTIFANESGNQPSSQLDNMFGDVWDGATLSCTVTGTNALTLTPRTNVNLPTSYVPNQRIAFTATATSTGSMTAQIGSLAALNIYQPGGTQAGAGNIVINTYYELAYDPALNTGSGGWWMVSATASTPSVAQPIQGAYKNLVLTVASNTQITPTADQLILQNNSGGTVKLTSFAPSNTSTASNGANGLDSGSVAASTWYAWYAIYNPTTLTAAGLLSTSFTSPALPSGYTYFARLGAFVTDGSANLKRIIQKGNRAQYVIGTNPTVPLIVAQGTSGTYSPTSPGLASASVASFVPTTATRIYLMGTGVLAGGSGNLLAAPNTSWGGPNNGPEGSNDSIWPIWTPASGVSITASWMLEASTIGFAGSNANAAVAAIGWDDNLA